MMPMWMQLMFLIGIPLALILTNLAWILNHVFLTPKECKIIKKASRKKKGAVMLGSDDGYADLESLDITGKSGYSATSKKPEDRWVGFHARSIEEPEETSREKRIAQYINKLASRKMFLRHAKIPIWFGYSGKAILTSLYALIAHELTKEIAEKLKASNPGVIIDLTEIKSLFPKPWDESQLRANEVDAKTEGMLEAKKFFGMEGLKYFVLPGMIIIAIMVLAIIFLVLGT